MLIPSSTWSRSRVRSTGALGATKSATNLTERQVSSVVDEDDQIPRTVIAGFSCK